jgi:hypothetical protein
MRKSKASTARIRYVIYIFNYSTNKPLTKALTTSLILQSLPLHCHCCVSLSSTLSSITKLGRRTKASNRNAREARYAENELWQKYGAGSHGAKNKRILPERTMTTASETGR